MAKSKKKTEEQTERIDVAPKSASVAPMMGMYKPLPKFRGGCANC